MLIYLCQRERESERLKLIIIGGKWGQWGFVVFLVRSWRLCWGDMWRLCVCRPTQNTWSPTRSSSRRARPHPPPPPSRSPKWRQPLQETNKQKKTPHTHTSRRGAGPPCWYDGGSAALRDVAQSNGATTVMRRDFRMFFRSLKLLVCLLFLSICFLSALQVKEVDWNKHFTQTPFF